MSTRVIRKTAGLALLLCFGACTGPEQKREVESQVIPVEIQQVESKTYQVPVKLTGLLATTTQMKLSFKTGGLIDQLKVREGLEVSASLSAGGNLVSGFHNSTWIDQTGVPLASDTWVHLAVVRNNGTLVSYINGVDSGMNTTTAAIPFGVAHLGIQPFSGNLYAGLMDELRIFSFESGDDYVAAFNIPEPATMSLLALGGLVMLRRRKK